MSESRRFIELAPALCGRLEQRARGTHVALQMSKLSGSCLRFSNPECGLRFVSVRESGNKGFAQPASSFGQVAFETPETGQRAGHPERDVVPARCATPGQCRPEVVLLAIQALEVSTAFGSGEVRLYLLDEIEKVDGMARADAVGFRA